MPYASKQDLIDRFGETEMVQITDRDGTGLFDDATFAKAQADGDAEIDAYLQGRYALPLAHVPTILCRLACDLYRYYLYFPRLIEDVEKRYERSVKLLEGIRDGRINLGLDAGQAPEPAASPVRVSSRPRIFGDDTLGRY